MDFRQLTAMDIADGLRRREFSSREVTQALLDWIGRADERVKAFISVDPDVALRAADAADKRFAEEGRSVPRLCGIPVAVKDNMCTTDYPTTCGSKILHNFHPPYDATAVAKLREAGAVIIGKTNLDEFAMGSSTEHSAMKITSNPWDLERVPGGSSGGSAAAVAARMAPLALGSDTGGSIRQPASFCGVVGMKPTYGKISRYGLVAFGSSLDQIGPMARSVGDAAALLGVVAGHDPRDSTSANVETPDYTAALGRDIKGMKIGRVSEHYVEGLDGEVRARIDEAFAQLESLGAEIVEVSLPHSKYSIAAYYICAMAEASSNLARYDGAHYGYRCENPEDIVEMFSRSRAEGFGREVKRRIMIGTYALSSGYYDAYYLKALKVRTLIKRDFEKAYEKCDVIAGPVSPTPAFKIGEKTSDPLEMYLTDIYTISLNLAGHGGVSIPCGLTAAGLPVGLQLMAPAFGEEALFRVASVFEAATEHNKAVPPIVTE